MHARLLGCPAVSGSAGSAVQRGALGVELPTRNQILHGHGVVARTQAVPLVKLVRLLDLSHVEFNTEAGFFRHLHMAVDDLQRLFRQLTCC